MASLKYLLLKDKNDHTNYVELLLQVKAQTSIN